MFPPFQSLNSWDQYKAYVWLFTQIGVGIRQSCRPLTSTFIDSRGDVVSATGLAQALRDLFTSQAERDRVSHGGVCSSYCLLEMAHTHYHLLPKRRAVAPQSQAMSRRVTQTSHAASVPTSPKRSIEPLITPRVDSVSVLVINRVPETHVVSDSHPAFAPLIGYGLYSLVYSVYSLILAHAVETQLLYPNSLS